MSLETASSGAGFSPRQVQIMHLLAEGKSNKEIASDLKIAYGTVKQHVFAIFRKMDVTNRAKAIVVAQNIVKAETRRIERQPQPAMENAAYQWRLISAAALVVPEQTDLNPSFLAKRDAFLSLLHQETQRIVEALDGQMMPLPDGGVLAWFGHPKSHQDDAERIVYLVQLIQHWLAVHNPAKAFHGRVAIGVASHTEVIAESAEQIFAVNAFRMAVSMANMAAGNPYPLVSALTRRLTPDVGHWQQLHLPAAIRNRHKLLGSDVYALSADQSDQQALIQRWGGLPFVEELSESARNGIAQWLSVACWPSVSAPSLVEAIGAVAQAQGFEVLRLRMPHRKTRDVLLNSLFKQIELAHEVDYPDSRSIKATAGERLGLLLGKISEAKPLCVLVFGFQALETFKAALTEKGIDRLVSRAVLLVAVTPATEKPQAVVRSLGPRANGLPFSRAYTLQLPDMEQVVEKMSADVQALLDELSPLAREIIHRSAHAKDCSVLSVLASLSHPHHQLQNAMHELTTLGLLIPGTKGEFEFQDVLLAETIRQMDVPLDGATQAS